MAKKPEATSGGWISQVEKKFGKGTIQRLGGGGIVVPIESYPTGAITLDLALGVGGIPRGRLIEVFGPESSGKTTLTLTIIANAQKVGGRCAFIDAEHALDPTWAKRIGVRLEDLPISQPDCGEQALEIAEMMINSGEIDLIVIDSVAALTPKAEIDGEMGDSHVGLQARLMSQACRKLTGAMAKHKCTVIFINQIREKIGVMFGSPETTTGGRALKFYSSIRIDVRRTSTIKEGEVSIGNEVRARIVKNKVAPPFRDAQLKIYFGRKLKDGTQAVSGIDGAGALIDAGVALGIVEKSGSWLNFGSTRLGLGVAAAGAFIRNNEEVAKDLREKILAANNGAAVAPVTDPGFDEDEEEEDEEAESLPDETPAT